MSDLLKGRRLVDEGAGKDRVITKHGRNWRYRTTAVDALPTFAPTRGGEATATMGGGYCITVMGLDDAGEVERGADDKPLPLATTMLTIDAETLAQEGFDPARFHLEKVNEAIDAAAMRRTNLQALCSFCDAMVTKPEELAAPAGERPPIGMLPEPEPVVATVVEVVP